MKPNNVSIGFSDRKRYNLRNRLLLASYIVPFVALLLVDLTQKYTIPIAPIALTFLAFNMLGATLWNWYKYIHFFGFPSLQSCRKMLELDAIKASLNNQKDAKGKITGVVVVALVLAVFLTLLWQWTSLTIFLFPAVYSLSVAVKGPIRRSRPPAVLLLGGSSYDGTRLQLQLVSIFDASLVMSGLFHKEDATVRVSGMFSSDFNSIRTADYSRWQEMIVTILQLSKIVIIDIRKITEAVQFEIVQVTKLLDSKQVFFIGQSVDSIPPERCFGEMELLNELRMKYNPKKTPLSWMPSTVIFEDKKNEYFRFIPPAGWICTKQPDPRTKVTFSHPTNPGVYFGFIVGEDNYFDFASLVRYEKKAIQELETISGATCEMEITEFAGRETVEVMVKAKNSEVILIRVFRTNGLQFTITYVTPNKATFDAYLDEVNHSLETIKPLHGIANDYEHKQERISQQALARDLRLAELSADIYDINKANKIIADLLRRYPNNKDVLKMAEDLEKVSKRIK